MIGNEDVSRIWVLLLFFLLFGNGILLGGNESLIVSWQPNSEADLQGYKVYYGLSSRKYSKVSDVGNMTRYTITDLEPGVEYFLAITAYDTASNESGFSEEVSAVTVGLPDSIPPSSPVLVTHSVRGLQIYLHWQDNQEVDLSGYKIHYGTSSGDYSTVIDVGNVTNYTTNDLTRGIKYYIVLTAYDISGNDSEYSEEIEVLIPDIDTTPPPIPIFIGHSVTGREVSLSWNDVEESDLGGYKIYYGMYPGMYDQVADVRKATNFVTTKLYSGVDYYFTVTSYDTFFNESDFSVELLIRLGKGGVVDSLLVQNYPNPFSESTVIEYAVLDSVSYVKMAIYDMLGRFIIELIGKYHTKGTHSIEWAGRADNNTRVPSGVYICRLMSGHMDRKKYATCKMIVLR